MKRILIIIAISLGGMVALWSGLTSIVQAADHKLPNEDSPAPLTSVLYRFDPVSQSFFTVPLPLGSTPLGVVVTGTTPTQVWVTEYGSNQIGQVIFTSTVDYQFTQYPVTSVVNSQPFRLAVQGDQVWFTERGANRVGRLNATTGQLDEFYGHGLATNAGLADIQIAPDGAVWLAGQQSNQIIRLTVNSPNDYAFQSFTDTLLSGPFGLAIENADSIWFTAPAAHRIGRLTPSLSFITWPQVQPSDFKEPYEIVLHNGSSWTTDRMYNRVSAVAMDTLTLANSYGPVTRPASIAVRNSSDFWLAQQDSRGAIARFVYTSDISYTFDSFALPISGLLPTGIDIAADNSVWLAAYRPYQIYLPLIARNYPSTSHMGVQLYGSLSASTGFTRVIESQATWVRFPVSWGAIEPQITTPDQYNWADLDTSLATAREAGIQVILTIDGNPAWAASTPSGPVTNLADLSQFVGAIAQRYPFIHYIELYNEPDAITRYGFKGAQYAAMLQAVYPAIKAANPDARVVLGGLALDWFTDQGGPFDRNFLNDVLNACGSAMCFDIANFHYYSFYRSQWESYGRDIIGKANYVWQVLAGRNFLRPVIVTETDWPSGLSWSNSELAARYVPKVYARSLAANLSAAIWFAMLDATPGAPGLLDNTTVPGSLIPRPAYDAFRVVNQMLGGAEYVQTITQTTPASSPIEGYQFKTVDGKRLDVYWYDCPSMTLTPPQDCDNVAPLNIAATRIAEIDKFGNTRIVLDEDDGNRDGFVTLGVLSSPIYVVYAP